MAKKETKRPRQVGLDKSLSGSHRLPVVTPEVDAFILGEIEIEIDETLDRLGAGIERESARMDELLSRLRKTRISA